MNAPKHGIRIAAIVLLLCVGPASADDDRFIESQLKTSSQSIGGNTLTIGRNILVAGSAVKTYHAPAATPVCVCTNLQSVTVICPECDAETQEDLCFTHDNVCKDRAQLGGIRESHTFFCTTPTQ